MRVALSRQMTVMTLSLLVASSTELVNSWLQNVLKQFVWHIKFDDLKI